MGYWWLKIKSNKISIYYHRLQSQTLSVSHDTQPEPFLHAGRQTGSLTETLHARKARLFVLKLRRVLWCYPSSCTSAIMSAVWTYFKVNILHNFLHSSSFYKYIIKVSDRDSVSADTQNQRTRTRGQKKLIGTSLMLISSVRFYLG